MASIAAKFFFPPGENVVPGQQNGVLVDRLAGPLVDADYDNVVFELPKLHAANLYGKVREWTLAGHVQLLDGATLRLEGDFDLPLVVVPSGPSLVAIDNERDLCNHGGWYGSDSTQPNWVTYFDDDGNPTAPTPYAPGPITLRFGDCIPLDGFRVDVNGVWYVAIGSAASAGPTILFLDGYGGIGEIGCSFGAPLGFSTAELDGVLPAELEISETGFILLLAGPQSSGVYFNLVGTLTLTPTRWWGHGGLYDETTGERV